MDTVPVIMGFARKMNSLAVMGRSSHAKRIEPDGPEFLEAQPEILQHLINAGWDRCIFLFQGHDVEITSQLMLQLKALSLEYLKLLLQKPFKFQWMGKIV